MLDPILYWNEVALDANRESHTNGRGEQTGPTMSARALGIVHAAMYDAFAGVMGNPVGLPVYTPGLLTTPLPPSTSVNAAVAGAAHHTLSVLFPSQSAYFDSRYAQANLDGPGVPEGEAFGKLCAKTVLENRKNDPGAGNAGYVISQGRGHHRADPDNSPQAPHGPYFGNTKGFAITKDWTLDSPPAPVQTNAAYRRALEEVRNKGIATELTGSVPNADRRTSDEEIIGIYWAYDGAHGLGTPPRLYNQIVRVVAEEKGNTPAQNARLFALVNIAMADAAIRAWSEKYRHDLWRPVLGVREHDTSMGPAGAPGNNVQNLTHISWLPLGAPKTNEPGEKNFTPPFPAYPSGHASFGAAAFHITRLFYGPDPGGINNGGVSLGNRGTDNLFSGLSFVSEELNGVNTDNKGTVRPRHDRRFPGGLWQMIEENGRSRVYLGVHWVFDAFAVKPNGQMDLSQNVGGVALGINIAEDIFSSGMTPSV